MQESASGAELFAAETPRISASNCERDRARKHHPAWLSTGRIKIIAGAVHLQLTESDHPVKVNTAFCTINEVRSRQLRTVRCCISNTAEAVSVRFYGHPLYAQKQFVQVYKLSWSTCRPSAWGLRTVSDANRPDTHTHIHRFVNS